MKLKCKPAQTHAATPVPVPDHAIARWSPTHGQISSEAEEIWRLKGCPTGQDDAIWLEAEHGLLQRRQWERDKRDMVALADPGYAFNADRDDLMTELKGRFPDRTEKEPTSL